MSKGCTTGFVVLLGAAFLVACGSSGAAGFGTGDGGQSPTVDGTVGTHTPDGSVTKPSKDAASSKPAKDASTKPGKDASSPKPGKDGSSPKPGKDGSSPTPGKDSSSPTPGKDASTPGYDAAPPPPVTPCDLCTAGGGQCTGSVCVLTENPGNLSGATQTQLQGGGTADPSLAWLYPYDQTVFPQGILSPTLQFAGTAPDATWVSITFPHMTYNGYFGPSSAPLGGGQVALSSGAWNALTAMATATDVVQVSLTKISAGQVAGPITETWTIAQGALRGTIYYETYGSAIAGGIGGVGIMKITPGASKPVVVKSGCGNVCHTASADGSTLVSATGVMGIDSVAYDLKTSPISTIYSPKNQSLIYGGLYPDGTMAMSATNYRTWILAPSRLYDTSTGAKITTHGWDNTITNAGTSTFSADGTHIAFNHEDETGGAGHTLAVMDFAVGTYTFSNLTDIATDSSRTLAWPAWTPDGASIVYHAGSSTDFETDEPSTDAGVTGVPTTGDVYIVDFASHQTARLDALDGYDPGGTSYLPANDPDYSFAPTVLPEAVGGYFWVVFTSHRSYGNTRPSLDSNDQNGKLWVAALDIGGTPGQDSSHRAFYLDGQELTSDNLRGFWVLDPCQAAGSPCTGGDQCCQGYCEPVSGQYECVGQPASGCSATYEKCQTAANCCDTDDLCINHLCATPNGG